MVEMIPTSPQRGGKMCFSIALIFTAIRRIPVSASANQESENGDLIGGLVHAADAGHGGDDLLPGPRGALNQTLNPKL